MPVLLGIDGGGTTTHVLAVRPSGEVVGSAVGGASNWENVGIVGAGEAIRASVIEALDQAGAAPGDVVAAMFGLAGLDWDEDRRRLMSVPDSFRFAGPYDVVNDAFVALRAGTARPFGVVVVAGSGSVAAGKNARGETFRTFGLGRNFGDFGGSEEISQEAVRAVAEAYTGKGPPTALGEAMCAATGLGSVLTLLEEISRARVNEAGFGGLVIRVADQGDEVARQILRSAGSSLAGSAAAVIRHLRMQEGAFEVVLSGAMLRGSAIMRDTLTGELSEVAPRATGELLSTMPVVGSVLLAMELVGMAPDPEVQERLSVDALERFHPSSS